MHSCLLAISSWLPGLPWRCCSSWWIQRRHVNRHGLIPRWVGKVVGRSAPQRDVVDGDHTASVRALHTPKDSLAASTAVEMRRVARLTWRLGQAPLPGDQPKRLGLDPAQAQVLSPAPWTDAGHGGGFMRRDLEPYLATGAGAVEAPQPLRAGLDGLRQRQRHAPDLRGAAHPQTMAKIRAGPPEPPACFGAPTTRVAPAAGTSPRPAKHSIP